MKISEVSKLYDIEVHTIRYYEKEGFLGQVKKNESNQRDFNTGNLVRLDMIIKLRNAGMNIAAIKEYVMLSNAGDETIVKRKEVLDERIIELDKQIEGMLHAREFLKAKIDVYENLLENK